jgi:hypothetical protein
MPEVLVGQVDRTDVRVEPLRDQIDDVLERLLQIMRSGDNLGDVRE